MENDDDAPVRFRNIGFAATWAGAITLICLLVGQGAEQYASLYLPKAAEQMAAAETSTQRGPQFSSIDDTVTGAIKGQSVTLSPCGPQKIAP